MLRSQRREIARTDEFGQLGMCSQSAASLFVAAIPNALRLARKIFLTHCSLFSRRHAFVIFPVKKIFLS
jgi:hypothetical protein